MDVALLTMDDNSPQPTSSSTSTVRPHSTSPMLPDSNEILRMLADPNSQLFAGLENSPKTQLERLLNGGFDDSALSTGSFPFDPASLGFPDISSFSTLRNSSKTLKCPKCNWHYKYQETLEIHMKEKHSDADVKCVYCVDNRQHPKLARGETYSCGYKPYRCDLCRYSTTTKGNLSIHMQSDKHLHAVQELPANIANFTCAPMSRSSPIEELDAPLICLICGVFATESLADMIEHVEKDRSRPTQGDVSIVNGCFRCHLCPYNTTLKANFQLHTRTDKHLQKVQTANHLREGARPHTAIYRLSSTKTSVQVLCRQCQEIISSTDLLREHCHSSAQSHQQQLKAINSIAKVWKCKICSVELESELLASGHMTCHEPSTWPDNIDFKMVEDAAYGCEAGCGFTTKNIADLEDHAKSHEEGESTSTSTEQNKTCPLCIELTDDLEKHLVDEHRIAESAIEKLLLVEQNAKQSTSEFSHRCTKCKMAFRTEAQLKTHSIQHVFSNYHKCPTCNDSFEDHNLLLTHMIEHNKEECEMCSESFGSKEQFIAHLNSTKHLQQAKKHLENTLVDLSSQIGNDDEKSRCFRCNVCNQSYPQANNLEIHMRSISHQTRMSRLSDLISSGEIDSDKPIVEQPGMPSPTIAQYIEQTTKQLAVNDVMSLLMKSETDENVEDPISGIHVLTQIKVYGESKIINLVAGLEEKIDLISGFNETKAAEVSMIDCSTCGQQISGILALNLHYEEAHSSSIPTEVLKRFGEKLLASIEEEQDLEKNGSPQSIESNDDEPAEKRTKFDSNISASQFAMFSQMMNYLPFMQPGIPPEMISQFMNPNAAAAAAAAAAASAASNANSNNSPAKRARTRITDEQLKVLRQYFNINNSPTEAQIKEMSMKASLPEKVIKHWFRNTLFKERQRDKDSPYNFNIPPQMGIDLDTYEKTGEAKVVSLSSGEKSEINSARATPTTINPSTSAMTPEENKPTPVVTPTLDPTKINIHTMLSQLQQSNSFPFLDASFMAAAAAGPMAQIAQQPCNTSSSGRRANRTRFTDFQLRTLQQFFDKQAYPKDDDLEALSKKLQLSPRVIVVWFQNARQKARKIYENQPNHENSDRFVRTPGSNFQCKRCNQVFQRYYELIQHQQKKCYKDDGAALMNDNKSVEESLSDEEKAQLLAQQQQSTLANFDIQKMQPNDLLKLLGGSQKSSNDVLLKMCESMGGTSTPSTSFHKMCPICAQTFREKSAIIEHLQQKHSLMAPIEVDLLPDADSMNDFKDSMALDLSGSSIDLRESISTSPTRSDDDILTEQLDDSQFATFGIQIPNSSGSRSPSSNKRYRTHLTPLQVQLMKNVFGDYKTPSMAECELLGKEIGLHKRVVQVWFQNARAKERKSKGHGEEELKSMETNCDLCDKQFATRLSLQDHLFSTEHISLLRNNLKKEGVSDVATDNGQPVEKKAKTSAMDMSSFPFNLMLGAGFPMVDVNLFGTPIPMLQIPEEVKTQIATDISESKEATVFSQDGQTIETLTSLLPEDEKANVEAVPKDVGWACTSCTNVFQEEKKLKEHQKTMCSNCDKMLTLTQIHYSCKLCSSLFCLQNDYIMHLHSLPHIQFKP